ncbi:ABC transporter substrate-binding protein [bacterium]|nr:ABC transporter substrate-binding protein [bacterium]
MILHSCVEERSNDNLVIQHISVWPDGLHPFNSNSAVRTFIFQYTQKTLIKLDHETLEYIPALVESMPEISENGLEYTYVIKNGIKWDDGSPLTAKDVEFSVKLMLCPLTNNTQIRSNYSTVIKSIELDEKNPLQFTMYAQNLHVDNQYIFSELYLQQKSFLDSNNILEKITFTNLLDEKFDEKYVTDKISEYFTQYNSDDNSYIPEKLVGLGPYQVTTMETDEYIILTKKDSSNIRDNWWGEGNKSIYNQNYPNRIIFKIIKEDAAVYLSLKSNKIDVSNRIGTKSFTKLREREYFNNNYDSEYIDRYSYSYMGFNCKPDGIEYKKFFTDKNVRKAIAYTIPIDDIIEVILDGKASRQAAQISPLKRTYNDTLKLIPLDIEKAKRMLDLTGWIDTDGDNIRDKIVDGEKLQMSFKLSYMSSPISKEIVLMIKESMYKAGVDAIPNPMDFTLFYKNAQEHKFDAMMGGWGGSASYSNPMQLWHTTSWVTKGSNFCGFGDAESDSYIKEANSSIEYDKHKSALWKLQAKIYEEQPYVFMYASKNKIAISKRFDNRNMYTERPGVILNNLKLNNKNLVPTSGEN